MDHRSGQKRADAPLYPPIEPFDQRMMEVGDGHQIYVEQSGHHEGVPVLVLHGGPGGGCSPTMRRFFDPAHYRVVMFDQRGCGRSRPTACVEANTTWHLVADIEHIREQLGIDRFILFGGSWGATLALIYAISHPERVLALTLRGVFLGTEGELDWFYGGGAGRFFPEMWARFNAPIPEAERHDLIAAYHRRLFSGDRTGEAQAGRIWANWENALASVHYDGVPGEAPSEYARTFARLENHYFTHRCFLDGDDWIIRNRAAIEPLPAVIVQGRLDMICPPFSANRLATGWDGAELRMIPLAGHALSEPGISGALVAAMNAFRAKFA